MQTEQKCSIKRETEYQDLIRQFIAKGYALVSKWSIDTDDFEYHVPCDYAKTTTIVLHRIGEPFVVVLKYREVFGEYGRQYWDVRYFAALKPFMAVSHLTQGPWWEDWDYLSQPPKKVGYDWIPELEGFKSRCGSVGFGRGTDAYHVVHSGGDQNDVRIDISNWDIVQGVMGPDSTTTTC